jgi:hypothetical protein
MSKRSFESGTAMRVASVVLVAVSLTGAASDVAAVAAAQTGKANDGWVFAIPKRRAADAAPVTPPPVLVGAESLRPTTIDIVVRRDTGRRDGRTLRQTVSRTSDRIHIAGNDRREWLFERNPIDPRRVSAALVDHAAKAIVRYEESDLRMVMGIRGWSDAVTLGFDSQLLSVYKRTEDVHVIDGVRFVRYAAAGKHAPVDEVWWSKDHILPSRFAIADGGGVTRFSVGRVRPEADTTLLRPADARFPTYRVYSLADWLEGH